MIATPDHLKSRLAAIHARIDAAARKSGRSATAIHLLAATKTVLASTIVEAAREGVTDIGENRVQEAASKRDGLAGTVLTHHLIGQLQTNKARRAVELFDVIQSVDRLRVAEAISRAALELGKRQRCLVEVKISDDATKAGVGAAEADDFIAAVRKLPNIDLSGVMAIAPLDASEDGTRAAFRQAAEVFSRHRGEFGPAPILSMGMSDDFELAIAEGSTMVRVGRALFGERKTEHA